MSFSPPKTKLKQKTLVKGRSIKKTWINVWYEFHFFCQCIFSFRSLSWKIIYNWNWNFRFRSLGVQQYKYAQHLFRFHRDEHSARAKDEILTKHVNSFRKLFSSLTSFVENCKMHLKKKKKKNHIMHERREKTFHFSPAPCKEYTKAENHFKNGINKFLLCLLCVF